jgi:probable nitrogen fixation protein
MELNVIDDKIAIDPASPALALPFVKQMALQLRAMDGYGAFDTWSDARVLDPLVLTRERRRAIPVVGDPDEVTLSRVKAYYNALAQTLERETGLMAVPVINITHEGFGRALILVGKLVAFDKTLRDVHRFGFDSLEEMAEEAGKLVAKAVAVVAAHRAVAEL